MSTVDMRAFVYPLQVLMQRKQWQADKGLREMAAALGRLRKAEEECEQLSAACDAHAQQARQAWGKRTDPASYQRLLVYLAGQQQKKAGLEDRRQALQLEYRQAQASYVALQKQLEGLGRHREGCQDDYEVGERTRLLVQADQDWVARQQLPHAGVSR